MLESGGGWIGYWLDRIDAVYGHTFIGTRVPLEHKPSDYFRERVLDLLRSRRAHDPGARRAVRRRPVHVGVATSPTPTTRPSTSTTSTSSPSSSRTSDRRKFLGDNCRQLFKIDV